MHECALKSRRGKSNTPPSPRMMGAILTITPLSPQGMRRYFTMTPLSPQGMGAIFTITPLSPQGMRAIFTMTPLSPQGIRRYFTMTPSPPQGTRRFFTMTPLSPQGMRVYPQKNDSTTIYNESLSVWAQLSETFSQDFDQDRPGTTHETLHSDDHQYQAHESHHDVVAGLP